MGLAKVLVALKVRAAQLWADDQGAVISTEYVLVGGVLVTGVVPGLVAARNSLNTAYVNMGNSIVSAVPSPTYSGYAIGGTNGTPVASVGGMGVPAAGPQHYLAAVQVAPPAP